MYFIALVYDRHSSGSTYFQWVLFPQLHVLIILAYTWQNHITKAHLNFISSRFVFLKIDV